MRIKKKRALQSQRRINTHIQLVKPLRSCKGETRNEAAYNGDCIYKPTDFCRAASKNI